MTTDGPGSPEVRDEGAEPRPVTLAFMGWASLGETARVSSFEDRVLRLLVDHGGEVVFRGRQVGTDEDLPTEVHILRLPSRAAYEAYLADEGRQRLLEEYGEIFTEKVVVEVDQVAP